MRALRYLGIAVVHFILTAGAIVGAMLSAAEAARAGLNAWPAHGTALREVAVVLAWPASAVLADLGRGSLWFWPLIGINSLLWALALTLVWRLYRARHTRSVA